MTTFVRGSTITFSATCADAAGAPVTPDSANLYLVYVSTAGEKVHTTVPMDVDGATVSATWDSSVADATIPLSWSIRTTGVDKIATDGTVELTANEANPVS